MLLHCHQKIKRVSEKTHTKLLMQRAETPYWKKNSRKSLTALKFQKNLRRLKQIIKPNNEK